MTETQPIADAIRKAMKGEMIYHGDCLDIMPTLPDKSIDLILCDLPYGTTACKWDTIIPFEPLWKQYKRLIKDNGAIVLTASQPFTSALVMSNPGWFKYEWIWDKKDRQALLYASVNRCVNTKMFLFFIIPNQYITANFA